MISPIAQQFYFLIAFIHPVLGNETLLRKELT